GRAQGLWRGEERLEQEGAKEGAVAAAPGLNRAERRPGELREHRGFLRRRVHRVELELALAERVADFGRDVLLEAADVEALDVVLRVVVRVRDGGRLEQVHQAGEALGLAVVGR